MNTELITTKQGVLDTASSVFGDSIAKSALKGYLTRTKVDGAVYFGFGEMQNTSVCSEYKHIFPYFVDPNTSAFKIALHLIGNSHVTDGYTFKHWKGSLPQILQLEINDHELPYIDTSFATHLNGTFRGNLIIQSAHGIMSNAGNVKFRPPDTLGLSNLESQKDLYTRHLRGVTIRMFLFNDSIGHLDAVRKMTIVDSVEEITFAGCNFGITNADHLSKYIKTMFNNTNVRVITFNRCAFRVLAEYKNEITLSTIIKEMKREFGGAIIRFNTDCSWEFKNDTKSGLKTVGELNDRYGKQAADRLTHMPPSDDPIGEIKHLTKLIKSER